MHIKRYQPVFGETTKLGLDNTPDDLILSEAIAAHKADPDSKDSPIPKHLDPDSEIAVDPKEVAAGKEGEPDPAAVEVDKDKKAEDDYEPYIPELPTKPEAKPDVKKDPEKAHDPEDPLDPEARKFIDEIKDKYEDDTVKLIEGALEIGGKVALNKMRAEQAAITEKQQADDAVATAAFTERRVKEYQVIGNFQKDGRIPKVPVEVQKKVVNGTTLTKEEAELPGVQRQLAVWQHISEHNAKTKDGKASYYLVNFEQGLDSLEAKELRDGKTKQNEHDDEVRKKKAKVIGGGGGGGTGKDTKPKYVRGQGLESVAQDLLSEYQNV